MSTPATMPDLMSVKDAAPVLGLSPWTVYHLTQSGQLGCLRIGPKKGKIVITGEHIDQYLAKCECRGYVNATAGKWVK